ncbi:MAG TPA: aminotransferase class I/II-fold pyridoxal phosphate-dependent enzyme [Desertimonas sp.]|nr:aminotransferase class I/II-fold pyridoxal phosphate-dependent enzyme [Desertimonas sp.]
MQLPPPPQRSFASDNASGAHPDVLAAIVAANEGHALAYGDDAWTRECHGRFVELFGRDVETLLTFTGTGGNVLGLTTILRPVDAVVCAAGSHLNADEAGALERIAGAKLIDLPAPDGKLVPEQLAELAPQLGIEHHAQPAVVTITQSTELGTVYTASEVAALSEQAHSMGMKVHMDGARIANATAALGSSIAALRSMTIDAGVDVLTFGGTKNGLVGGEAVVFLDPALATRARFVRKSITQLPSKMRFVAAQFNALLDAELWLRNARHSNEMAAQLYDAVAGLPGVDVVKPQVNGLFPTLRADVIAPLQEWSFFWDWDVAAHQVRWMTSWDTTADDVDRFAAGVAMATVTSGTVVDN